MGGPEGHGLPALPPPPTGFVVTHVIRSLPRDSARCGPVGAAVGAGREVVSE